MVNGPVTPQPAATLLLLRQEPGVGLATLMTVRHEKMAFGSGALVFPGGRVDAGDAAIAAGMLARGEAAGASTAEELSYRIAAIRETFEECGILLVRELGGTDLIAAPRALALAEASRSALCRGEIAFADWLSAESHIPAVDALVPFAHWVTPPVRPKRFDTHFFVAAAPPGQESVHDGQEATESVWLAPTRAIEETASGRYKLLFATRMNLLRLSSAPSVEAALAAALASKIVAVTPEMVETAAGTIIRIPEAAGYGGHSFPSIDPPAM